MILGIGTDIVRVLRFNSWKNYSQKQLLHVFSKEEIKDFFTKKENLNLQTIASRFASKEAFYKAFSACLFKLNLNKVQFSFLFACKNIEIQKTIWNTPEIKINYQAFEIKIGAKIPKLNINLSLSHEKDIALAFVILST